MPPAVPVSEERDAGVSGAGPSPPPPPPLGLKGGGRGERRWVSCRRRRPVPPPFSPPPQTPPRWAGCVWVCVRDTGSPRWGCV